MTCFWITFIRYTQSQEISKTNNLNFIFKFKFAWNIVNLFIFRHQTNSHYMHKVHSKDCFQGDSV